ncbi:MAG: hypothetical protein Tsb0019_18090 [Roseibium sp.]
MLQQHGKRFGTVCGKWSLKPPPHRVQRADFVMVPSLRKFIGMVVLVIFVVVYAFTAMVIGDLTLQQSSNLVRFVYFAIAGLAWVIPAGAIIWWMERSGKRRT